MKLSIALESTRRLTSFSLSLPTNLTGLTPYIPAIASRVICKGPVTSAHLHPQNLNILRHPSFIMSCSRSIF